MASRHNLGTVINFEFWRTIKKPSFWIATLSFPLILGLVFGVIYYSGKTASDSDEKLAKETFSIAYKDESGIIQPAFAAQFDAKPVASKQQGIDDVKSGNTDAFFYYPSGIDKHSVEAYGSDAGLFDNGKYAAVAEQLLTLSANAAINDTQLLTIAQDAVDVKTTTYTPEGDVSAGWYAAAPALIFLVIFYFTIGMLGNNLLNSTVEEKENRVTEMILTTLDPTVLVVGKLIATFMAGILQALVMLTPAVIAYLALGSDTLNLPSADIFSKLVFDPVAMIIGALLLIGGLLLFTGTLVAIGAIMPTAKEAGQYFSIAILIIFIPFYIFTVILSDPEALVVQIFTYFPFTAPVTAMMRNAFGSLSILDAAIVITTVFALGVIIILLAVRLFRYGAMQYDSRLSFKSLRKSKG